MKYSLCYYTLLLFFLFLSSNSFAQYTFRHGHAGVHVQIQKKVELLEGEPSSLKKLSLVGIKYNFDSMVVCSFLNQDYYFKDLRENYSEKKAGKMINEWQALPKTLLEPKFEEFFNKNLTKIGIQGSNTIINQDQATLIVKVLEEDPHYHRGEDYSPPYVVLKCTFLDSEKNLMASFLVKAVGSRESNMADRRAECYAIGAKMLAKEVIKRLK